MFLGLRCNFFDDFLMFVNLQLLEKIGPATETLKEKGIDFSWWFKPENYNTDL